MKKKEIEMNVVSNKSPQSLSQQMTQWFLVAMLFCACLIPLKPFAQTIDSTPDGLVQAIVNDVLTTAKTDKDIQSGNLNKIIALVDQKIVPYSDLARTTQLAMGRHWSKATPEQQKLIIAEFKLLLIRTYAGALSQVKDQSVQLRPFRMNPDDTEVVVRTQVMGKGDPVQLDYRLEKTANNVWRVYDLNVLGAWLVEAYKGQFNNQISQSGIDGLITFLQERNKALSKAK
ncbi:phospholipid transport system substrate-binding protein [Polynucleobacter kasalickyi]|uniref:Phospholipid transport system substrate-binding protein n=2 Tax=Polynucleobacter kasalickyi TaxID=1938817 RepID=A0A1W2BZK1_9BURK|nr:phospholipid transport system substrate-binding protein [Polynucleobacter kasalickyi]